MTRVKPKDVVVVTSLDEADTVLRNLADIKRKLDANTAKLNSAVEAAKARAAKIASPLEERQKELQSALHAFAKTNKPDLFKSKKTLKRNFGRFGFRASTTIDPKSKSTWADVQKALEQNGQEAALSRMVTVDKKELGKWTDEKLKLVGCRRVTNDTFWIETNAEELAK